MYNKQYNTSKPHKQHHQNINASYPKYKDKTQTSRAYIPTHKTKQMEITISPRTQTRSNLKYPELILLATNLNVH